MEKSDFVRVAGAAKPFGEYENRSGEGFVVVRVLQWDGWEAVGVLL